LIPAGIRQSVDDAIADITKVIAAKPDFAAA
jgi:hypothetical protein